jgi:tetratricopeptide (TPR) repeat protein
VAINREKILENAQRYVERKKYDKAVAELRQVVAADPTDARSLQRIAELEAKQGHYTEALDMYDATARLYATGGFAKQAIAVYQQARQFLMTRCPQLEPRYGHMGPRLVELLRGIGLNVEALAVLKEIAARTTHPSPDAIEVFRQIAELDPQSGTAHLRLAEALAAVRDIDGAVHAYEQAVRVLVTAGRRDDAIQVLERLLMHKQDPEAARVCAELYLERGRPNDARQALARLQIGYAANPHDVVTLALIARGFDAIQEPMKALEIRKEIARIERGP